MSRECEFCGVPESEWRTSPHYCIPDADDGLSDGQWPPKGYEVLDCEHVVKPKSHPIIHVGERRACCELCAQRLENSTPDDPFALLKAIAQSPSGLGNTE
jgi:hypothetical protein